MCNRARLARLSEIYTHDCLWREPLLLLRMHSGVPSLYATESKIWDYSVVFGVFVYMTRHYWSPGP